MENKQICPKCGEDIETLYMKSYTPDCSRTSKKVRAIKTWMYKAKYTLSKK